MPRVRAKSLFVFTNVVECVALGVAIILLVRHHLKILASGIRRELESKPRELGTDCAIYEDELQRIWPLVGAATNLH